MDSERIRILVLLAQEGDREAFGRLVAEFESSIIATVMKRLKNRTESLDVTQEVFLRAMRKLHQLREPERFVGWLHRIAVRLSINKLVRKRLELSDDADSTTRKESGDRRPIEHLISHERADQLRDGMKRLKKLDRETLTAFYFEGQSLAQMAEQFDSPIGTIKRRLHTARNRLRDELSELQTA